MIGTPIDEHLNPDLNAVPLAIGDIASHLHDGQLLVLRSTVYPGVTALVERSNRLGADPRNTNYAGGNTSAKGTETDPVTGEPVELVWVKGSGGDLGTLTPAGLAALRLDRMRAAHFDDQQAVRRQIYLAEREIEATPQTFTVTFAKSDRTVQVRADQFILATARERGVTLPSSCRTGLCGTCKSKLLSGTVDMQHQGGIRRRETDAGLFLPCCSKPLSDLVVDR